MVDMGEWREGVWVWKLSWRRSLFVWEENLLRCLLDQLNQCKISEELPDGWARIQPHTL